MIYPGYQLNPGDMFQVEPERVMYATGASKDAGERRATRQFRKQKKTIDEPDSDSDSGLSPSETESRPSSHPAPAPADSKPAAPLPPQTSMKDLLARAKSILQDPKDTLPAKRKQDLRALQSLVRKILSRPTNPTGSIDAQILELTSRLNLAPPAPTPASPTPSNIPAGTSPTNPATPSPASVPVPAALGAADRALLRAAMIEAQENPFDPSKAYATPWRPRDFMSAFAFIPRYLEVHHRICSAVYLRHPVARPGLAEIPTPYSQEINALAYVWYLRRR